MVKVIFLLLLSILIDGLLSSYFAFITPFVFIGTCIYVYPMLKVKKQRYCFLIYFLVYDLLFSNVFLLYTFLYVIILILVDYIYKMFGESYIKIIMFTIVMFLVNYLIISLIFSERTLLLQSFLTYFICSFFVNNIYFFFNFVCSKK